MKIWSHPPGLNRRPTDYESNFGASGGVKGLILLTRGADGRRGVTASTGTRNGTVRQSSNTSTFRYRVFSAGGI
jgi:hypothetical protein